MFKIEALHHITQDNIPGFSHALLAEAACRSGVKWVQLRMKHLSEKEMKVQAIETQSICKVYGATFIINDHVELAKEVGADGVHLGKTDMAPTEAKAILGKGYIIGGTANSFEDLIALHEAGIDYIGLGPFRFTQTKENLSPVLGLDGMKNLLLEFRKINKGIPIIGIGGILPDDVPSLLGIGIDGVAVSSFINKAENKKEATLKLLNSFSTVKG